MKLITSREFKEYQQLKEWAKKQQVYQSARNMKDLYSDIDAPIRKCVAMLALLKCEPTFSCCGFDYEGQPFHKSHQYGEPYIRIKSNIFSTTLLGTMHHLYKYGWNFRPFGQEYILELITQKNPHWRNSTCIHFSEECVIGIHILEKEIFKRKDSFDEYAIVIDTNLSHKHNMRFWQYPPKTSWVVYKEQLENY